MRMRVVIVKERRLIFSKFEFFVSVFIFVVFVFHCFSEINKTFVFVISFALGGISELSKL